MRVAAVRAVAGLPLGDASARGASAMVNLIGEAPPTQRVLEVPGAHLHLYNKQPRPGRKIGHVTLNAADERLLTPSLEQLRRLVRHPSL